MPILERLIVEIDSNFAGVERGLKSTGKRLDEVEKKSRAVGRVFAGVAAGVAGATIALGKFAEAGGKVLTVQSAFNARTKDQVGAIELLRKATSGLVSDFELMTQANTALTLGSAENVEGFAELARTAQTLGRALGLDTTFALNSLNIGIARQSRLVLDNLGLIVSVKDANEEYAKAIGVTVAQLDNAQRSEAFRIAAMERAREKIEEMGGVTLNAGDAWVQLTTEITNAADALRIFVAESDGVLGFFEGIRRTLVELRGGPSAGAQGIIEGLGTIENVDALQQRYEQFFGMFPGVQQAAGRSIGEIQESFEELGIVGSDLGHILEAILDRIAQIAEVAKDIVPPTLAERLGVLLGAQTGPAAFRGQNVPGAQMVGGGRSAFLSFRLDRSAEAQERLAKATQKTADGLFRLSAQTGDTESAFDGIRQAFGGGVTGAFDPATFFAGLGTNLAGSFLSLLGSGLADVFGAAMTEAERRAQFEAVAEEFLGVKGERERIRQGALDIDDPGASFAALQESLLTALTFGGGGNPAATAAVQSLISGITVDNIGEILLQVLDMVNRGTLAGTGAFSPDQLLEVLVELESLADSADKAASALDDVATSINQPAGVKVALERFIATELGLELNDLNDRDLIIFDPKAGGDTDDGGGGDGGDDIDRGVLFTGDIIVNGDSGRELFNGFVEEVARDSARGGSSDLWLATNRRPSGVRR